MIDKRKLNTISYSILAVLLVIFFIPFETAGRVIAAIAFAISAVVMFFTAKKRSILSINKQQVTLIVSTIAAVYLMLYYLSGIKFGFYRNIYGWNATSFFARFIPIAIIIAATEVFRFVVRAQEDKRADVLCYFSCVIADMLVCSTASVAISSFNNFMELVAETLFPAITANLLYHYLTKRYGMYPNMIYRAVTTLYIYVIPYVPAISNSLLAFIKLLVPLAIYLFIDALYEKKRRYALRKKSKLEVPITVIAIACMLTVVMLISNQFKYGTYVIATESMTGELNRGDAAIYERYDDQQIKEGQVIVFEKDSSMIVHRVVEIEYINGQIKYYTKGDANEDVDAGFITDANIVGLVNHKIPYIGFPTLWMRSLFKR